MAPFNRQYFEAARTEGTLVSRGVIELRPVEHAPTAPLSTTGPSDVPPSTGWWLALFCLGVLVLVTLVGYGWARTTLRGPAALALSPAFGLAALVLAGIALERLGLSPTGSGPPIASTIAGGGGYLAWYLRRGSVVDVEADSVPQSSTEIA